MALLLAASVTLAGQEATFRATTQIVSVPTTVIDAQGRLVPNLQQDQFAILDNGKPQEITFFQNETQPFTVVVMLDYSASMTNSLDLLRAAAEQFLLRLLPQDKGQVGAFSDRIEFFIPPKKGRDHVLYIVSKLITQEPRGKGTDLNNAVRHFNNAVKQKSIAFILSDFLVEKYDDPLRVAGGKHDVIGVKVYDKMDLELPRAGLLAVQDAETGKQLWIDTSNDLVRYNYALQFNQAEEACRNSFKKAGADLIYLRTDEDYVKSLQQFFIRRS